MMRREKRDLPDVVHRFETPIEHWRTAVLSVLQDRPDVAQYQLIATTAAGLAYLSRQLMPDAAGALEMLVRQQLFGLQFALAGIPESGSVETFAQHRIPGAITDADFRCAAEIIDHMSCYALARD